jgi:hypothetical protein
VLVLPCSGTAQGYWYFEGPVNDGGVSVLALYANQYSFGQYPVVGTLSIQYAADYLSSQIIAVSCQPSYMCNLWPSSLVNGMSSSVDQISYCFYNASAVAGTATDLVSKWTSAQGTTWMCSYPNSANPNAVNGSWQYINSPGECASRGESYPCTNNFGPYSDGITLTTPSGKGMIVTQWFGWNFGTINTGSGPGRCLISLGTRSGAYLCTPRVSLVLS